MVPMSIEMLSPRFVSSGRHPRETGPIAGIYLCGAICMAALGVMLAGCGGSSLSSGGAKAAPITVTNAAGVTGSVTTLAVANTLKLSMTPVGDTANAGVDWTLTCGGNSITGSVTGGACGTLVPAHTQDGATTVYAAPSMVPISGAVTVTATVTANPSQSSSTSFTIVDAPIGVAFYSNTAIPSSLQINATLGVNVRVTNDTLGGGVVWTASCSSGACGSFNPAVTTSRGASQNDYSSTYTAPSVVPGSVVTLTATSLSDTSRSASIALTITSPIVVPVTVNVLPSSLYVETSGSVHTVNLTAIVGNDSAGAGVTWSLSCSWSSTSSCGTISPSTSSGAAATYTGPAPNNAIPTNGKVTITATSVTNPAITASATATIVNTAPIVVTMSTAPPATLTETSSATLVAKVAGDTTGVDWTATCGSAGACGSFNPAHTASGVATLYTAPAAIPMGGQVVITATSSASSSTTPANYASAPTTIVAQSPSLTWGQTLPGSMPATTQAPVSATVANDVDSDGVFWSVTCGSTVAGGCGWISPVQTASGATAIYTAPPVTTTGTSVTVTAASVAKPSITISSNPIAINPVTTLSINFVPSLPAQLAPNATVNVIAAVVNVTTVAGVDWEVCAAGCGFFTIKPAIPAIAATATTPYAAAVPAVTATSVSGWPNGSPIPYTAPPEIPESSAVPVLAAVHADTTKAISGTIVIGSTLTGPALNGLVMAGSQTVAGASVSLYAAGTSGYGSAASQVATSTTGKSGAFTIPAGYTCPSQASQVYLVASGGTVGSNTEPNPNLALMTALGSCSNLSSTSVMVNEATTIASVYATAPFANNVVLNGNSSYLYLGTSSGNITGLTNAFAATNNLVDISTGQVRFLTPAGNGTVPYAEINTLADVLNACTMTSGGVEGDGSPCGNLFSTTDVASGYIRDPSGPTDTLQAAFNIAQHSSGGTVYKTPGLSLPSSNAPFQPVLTTVPQSAGTVDWSVSLNYSGVGGISTASAVGSFAVDAGGNLWITDAKNGTVAEWNAVGAAISPATGFPAGGGPIAIDASGNVWLSGDGVLNELTSFGTSAPGSPFGGVAGGGSDMAIDAQSDLWIASGAGVSEFNNLGQELSPAGGFTNSGVSGVTAVGVDSSNNVWAGFAELTNPGGQLLVGSSENVAFSPQLAANGSGYVWGIRGGQACYESPWQGKGWSLIGDCYLPGGSDAGSFGLYYNNPRGLTFDGAGILWIGSPGGGASKYNGAPLTPGVVAFGGGSQGNGTDAFLGSSSLAAGPLRVTADGSGDVWVLLADNTVTEYVGVATPVVTPLALGMKNKKLGTKP